MSRTEQECYEADSMALAAHEHQEGVLLIHVHQQEPADETHPLAVPDLAASEVVVKFRLAEMIKDWICQPATEG